MAAVAPKLGLALSGGGHRAAFFHIGVFAKLAELGLLCRVEVISTVSGGSIVGALYYLHVKNLLEDKPDETITDADYIEVVRQVERDYRGVRRRTFAVPPGRTQSQTSTWQSRPIREPIAPASCTSGGSMRAPGATGRSLADGSRCATC